MQMFNIIFISPCVVSWKTECYQKSFSDIIYPICKPLVRQLLQIVKFCLIFEEIIFPRHMKIKETALYAFHNTWMPFNFYTAGPDWVYLMESKFQNCPTRKRRKRPDRYQICQMFLNWSLFPIDVFSFLLFELHQNWNWKPDGLRELLPSYNPKV